MDDANQLLEDFLVFLGRRRIVETQQMPRGSIRYGRALHSKDQILRQYWETYQ